MMGGMGVVYFALDHENEDRPVALKTFRSELLPDRAARDRFLREGTTWIELGHFFHIVRCYKVFYQDPEPFLVLELVAKELNYPDASLRAWLIPGRPLPVEQSLLFGLQIVRGLLYAVQKLPGFVHRDLKPENVLVGADRLPGTNVNRLRVTDFGLASVFQDFGVSDQQGKAKTIVDSGLVRRTQLTNGIAGTPLYMAPEQWEGKGISIQSDIYAMGCMLYEMLAGQPVASGKSIAALERAHRMGQVKSLPDSVPKNLSQLVKRCMMLQPRKRYEDWEELEGVLKKAYQKLTGQAVPEIATSQAANQIERVAAGWSFIEMGMSYQDLDKAEVAMGYFERALKVAKAEGARNLEGAALGNLGNSYYFLDNVQKAIIFLEKAFTIAHEIGLRFYEQGALGNLGNAYRELGDTQRAIKYLTQAQTMARDLGDLRGEAYALLNLGAVYSDLGENKRAIGYYKRCLRIFRQIGQQRGEGLALFNLARAYGALRDSRRAMEHYEQALSIGREIGVASVTADTSLDLALLYLQQGDPSRALSLGREAVRLYTEVGPEDMAERAQDLVVSLERTEAIGSSSAKILNDFFPVIEAVVIAARGDRRAQAIVEANLGILEQLGLSLSSAIQHILAGERDVDALIDGLGDRETLIVREILRRLS
jgi:tetratricopeptide (TPR) repeat protein